MPAFLDGTLWGYMIQDLTEKSVYIPVAALVGAVGVAVLQGLFRMQKRTLQRPWLWFLWITYLASLLILTIFEREAGSRQGVSLIVFETFGNARMNSYVAENVLLFIPLGILAAGTAKPMRCLPLSVAVGVFISLCIEIVQLLTERGFFQVDDILVNGVGMGIGCILSGCASRIKNQ